MNLIERAKNIIIEPKKEWEVIEPENTPPAQLTVSYLLILALIPAVATFIGYGLIGYNILGVHVGSVGFGIRQAIVSYAGTVIGAFVTAFIIDALAPNFGSQKNFNQAFKLVVYSFTPMMIAGVLNIFHTLAIIALIVGVYGLYILYIGLQPLMKTPDDKKSGYFVVSILCVIVVYAVLGFLLATIIGVRGYMSI